MVKLFTSALAGLMSLSAFAFNPQTFRGYLDDARGSNG